jgi:hypothetical protein
MTAVAQMEIDVIDKKYRVAFFQALKGLSQILLINKGVGACLPTDADIHKLTLLTLEHNIKYFTKKHDNFHFVAKSIFTNFKEATNCSLATPAPITLPSMLKTSKSSQHYHRPLAGKVRKFQAKEKATLLQNTQQAFFKTATTKDAAEALAAEKTMEETNMDSVISNKIATEAKMSVPCS